MLPYLDGTWTHKGSFDQIMGKCKNNADTGAKFTQSDKVRRGLEVADFTKGEVKNLTTNGYRISRFCIAYSDSGFVSIYDKTPKSLGLRLRDTRSEFGKTVKAIVMLDPEKAGMRFEMYADINMQRGELKMQPGDHLVEKQDSERFDVELDAINSKGETLQKLRTTTLTHDEVNSLVAQAVAKEEAGAKNGDEKNASTDDDEDSD